MSETGAKRAPPVEVPERLWQLSADLMTVTDLQGRLLAVNGAWRRVLGWTEAELLASPVNAFVHPEDAADVTAELEKLAAGDATMKFECRLRRRDGVYRRISWRAAPAEGRIYAVGRDITERTQREEAARHTQKMEAIGQLTGGIAHDFNNLLTIVRSSIDFLKKPDLPEARRQRYVEAISEAVERATKVTNQLLAFARRQRLDPEVFDVGERIADVSELLRQLVGARIRIETIAPSEPCCVEADLCQFETALMNLAVNARDAMEDEGWLAIDARIVHQLPPIRGHAASEGEFVAVTVRDNGAGILPEQLPRVFEPFFTTKATGKGTGLGLSQVYGFVKQSGGGVDVQSEPGAGAAFTIYLPRSHAQPGRAGGPQARPAPAPASGLRVLVVEDNEEVGQFCLSMLRDLGYRPVWARNAGEADAALQDEASAFDLVFSDVVMPGMGGIELAEQIRRERPGLPVLLTSGYSAILAEQGARGFPLLAKPYSAVELGKALAEALVAAGVPAALP